MMEGKKPPVSQEKQVKDKLGSEWIYMHRDELKKLRESELKAGRNLEALSRLKVEFVEYQERAKREAENIRKFALEKFLVDLLPLLDTLDSTIAAYKDPKLIEGLQMIRKDFLQRLMSAGVKEIETIGKKFDPARHEAVATVKDDKSEPDTMVEEFKKGYEYNGKTLRPAMVKVNKPQ